MVIKENCCCNNIYIDIWNILDIFDRDHGQVLLMNKQIEKQVSHYLEETENGLFCWGNI